MTTRGPARIISDAQARLQREHGVDRLRPRGGCSFTSPRRRGMTESRTTLRKRLWSPGLAARYVPELDCIRRVAIPLGA